MLDVLIVAPHPDDAELGAAGAILRLKAARPAGRRARSDERRADAVRHARNPPARNGGGQRRAGPRLAREPRAAEPQPGAHARGAPQARGRVSPRAAAVDLRPVLGRCPSRSRGRDGVDRGRPLLVEAHQERHPRRAALSPSGSSTTTAFICGWPRSRRLCSISARIGSRSSGRSNVIESQFITGRPQTPPTFIDRQRDQAAYWGWSIGVRYGEPFASREPIGMSGFAELL